MPQSSTMLRTLILFRGCSFNKMQECKFGAQTWDIKSKSSHCFLKKAEADGKSRRCFGIIDFKLKRKYANQAFSIVIRSPG